MRQTKTKIEPKMESVIQVKLPMVRNFSTGGGHGPEDVLVEGDRKIVTKKWQGYPPVNLNVVGKPMPPLPEVAIPRFTGKAEYATRVRLPDMLHAKVLTCPHPHARIKNLDTSKAENMPGVRYVLTYRNAPPTYPLPQELNFQGEVVAIVAAETEDLAEDAVEAIEVEYETLPFASTVEQAMSPDAPDLRRGRGNLIRLAPNNPHYDPNATWVSQHGDVEKGFQEADIVKEFTYSFAGAVAVPMQPFGGVAKWDGDKLTFWGMGQGIYPQRAELARGLGIDPSKIRYINKYNGCTFGAAMAASRFNPYIAYVAKMAGKPVRLMLAKDQELAYLQIKPEIRTKFKVGARKDGRVIALLHEVHISSGDIEGGGHATAEISKNNTELYTSSVPHWKSRWFTYKTNAMRSGPVRSYTQQEVKWAWENMMDEMAEAVGLDPIQFRLLHISKPGTKLTREWHSDLGERFEAENGAVMHDSFASVEVLEEGAKAIGWDNRNAVPGGMPGRFKKGIGVGMSQHHAGHMGYHEGELYFDRLIEGTTGGGPAFGIFSAEGAAVFSAADKLRKDLLQRAAKTLNVNVAKLQMQDGVISSTEDPRKRITFAALARSNKGVIRQTGRGAHKDQGRALSKGVGACFIEVAVDTWTGDWRIVRTVYSHDTGLVVNPMVGEADMHGSLVQSTQMTTDAIPWDREFPGTRHYKVGYLSFRLPTIMDVPEDQTNIFIDSLEPRWFFGIKSFSETSIGAVPGAISNAIYNACGVRIREHPITREKILAGLKRGGTGRQ